MSDDRECPFCKESIKDEAIKCKHCHSSVPSISPKHEGVCPFCKEAIKADAIKCKHCHSMLSGDATETCGCSSTSTAQAVRSLAVPNNPGYSGNDCYYDCRDHMEGGGASSAEAYRVCQEICYISMPLPALAKSQFYRAMAPNVPGYTGNDCYSDCIQFIEDRGGSKIYAHMMCQDACLISMPFPNLAIR
ncbi:double zinc ribbon domain-containing protein [Cognaticolwellia beringensis]|uniref:DZANK-type domain-containing protein n=1 Tax=Cognaticolwellia beringensis TaxID=1967665 RepID=A0A222GBS7_9GAMM|nr:hypothetical protein B5D82_14185 [Cognaticolwellia beringensis]